MANQKIIRSTQANTALSPLPDPHTWQTPPETKDEALALLAASPLLYGSYQSLNPEWQQRFLDFCQGKKSLPLTYDPFFKKIFNPDVHPDKGQERKGLYIPGYEKGVYHRTV